MGMDLNTLWFILITVLFTGFFVLEGFDYGVGTLLTLVTGDNNERKMILRTITPVWDGNEVWMLTAGGATFAAFPHVYATMFSGMYMALFLMLLALIIRGIGFEYRNKMPGLFWQKSWDLAITVGSALPAILWGCAVTNLIMGMAINDSMTYIGGFLGLLTPATILGGVVFLLVFMVHGGAYLTLKLGDDRLVSKVRDFTAKVALAATVAFVALFVAIMMGSSLFDSTCAMILFVLAALSFIFAQLMLRSHSYGKGFVGTVLAILFTTVGVFAGLFPNIMISSLNPEWSLNIYNASSTPYTLEIMTYAALVFVPIVLVYQGWAFWHFRHPVRRSDVENIEY